MVLHWYYKIRVGKWNFLLTCAMTDKKSSCLFLFPFYSIRKIGILSISFIRANDYGKIFVVYQFQITVFGSLVLITFIIAINFAFRIILRPFSYL